MVGSLDLHSSEGNSANFATWQHNSTDGEAAVQNEDYFVYATVAAMQGASEYQNVPEFIKTSVAKYLATTNA